jgi:hypothetical protein
MNISNTLTNKAIIMLEILFATAAECREAACQPATQTTYTIVQTQPIQPIVFLAIAQPKWRPLPKIGPFHHVRKFAAYSICTSKDCK